MGYTAVPSVSTGETYTASNYNTYIKDNISYLKSQVSAQIWLSAGSALASTTSGASKDSQEFGTNDHDVVYMSFANSVTICFWPDFALPSDYDGGTFTAKFYWKHVATATNFGVVWAISGRSYADDDALDQSWGTAQTVTDTGGTTGDLYISSATPAITVAGTPANGQLVSFRAYRVGTDGADTLAVNAHLLGVLLTYTRT